MQIKRISGGGYDPKGNPIPVIVTWSDEIPCHYDTDSKEREYRTQDGSYAVFDYIVWTNPMQEDLTSKYVRLIDQYGEVIEPEARVEKCVNGQLRNHFFCNGY